jgi:lipopolysaccharide transport system ATP-binding protein
MNSIAIRVENLGKQYQIGGKQAGQRTFREALRDSLALPVRWMRGERRVHETFWALDDVSFEIKQGEAVGIIGRNGAGKSTLLKVLSRITRPTQGRVELYGRVASLLEVGTGFHAELSGRDNIYLNGAILGMSRTEIIRKFDEIVDFAEVEKFLDTPVKHYSSGMYVRLAFAVAAHLEPEILIVDEVLAVGDSQFQKKCLGKMGDVAREGRTVLFVSHNMAAIQQLCQRGVVLETGHLAFEGEIGNAIHHYVQASQAMISESELADRKDRQGSQWLNFTKVVLHDNEGRQISQATSGQDLRIRIHYTSKQEKKGASVLVSFNIRNDQDYLLTNLNSIDSGHENLDIFTNGYFECLWPKFNLRSGRYICNLFCSVNGEIVDWIQYAFNITVEDGDYFNTGRLVDRLQGDILVQNTWQSVPSLLEKKQEIE